MEDWKLEVEKKKGQVATIEEGKEDDLVKKKNIGTILKVRT